MAKSHEPIAKLSRPRLHSPVVRQRLVGQLDMLRSHPVIWVSGPPGAGKTALVAGYTAATGGRSIWYQLDSADTDPSSFFLYLREAAQRLTPRRPPMPLFTPEYLADLPGFSGRFFRELFSRLSEGGMLVLDNYHEIPLDSAMHRVLSRAVREIPPRKTVVILSRDEPPTELVRHVANGQFGFLGWRELKLTYEETRAVAASRGATDESLIEALHARSDGWAGGLVLMLEHLRRGRMAAEDVARGSREATFGYFAQLLLEEASETVQRSLMQISILPVATPSLAESLTGCHDAGNLLDTLYRRNLFVDRRPGNDPVYQLHALFCEFLAAKAFACFGSEGVNDLRRRAAKLLAEHNMPDEAFHMCVDAGDWAPAAALLCTRAETLFSEGRWQTLRDWIGQLPEGVVTNDPWIGYWRGVAEFQINPAASRHILSRAYARFESQGDALGQMATVAAILTGYYFEYADWKPADVWIERLARLLEGIPDLPTRELGLTIYSAMLYGMAIRQTAHPMLQFCIVRTMALLGEDADVNVRVQAGMAITGPVACMLGAFDLFHEARHILAPALRDPRLTEFNRACWHMTCGAKLSFDCEHEEAYRELETAVRLSQECNFPQIAFVSHHFAGLHSICYFELDAARESFRHARATADLNNPLQRTYLVWNEGMLACAAGDGKTAVRKTREAKAIGDAIGSAAHRVIGSVLLGGALALAGELDEAESVAHEAVEFGRRQKVTTWEASLLLLLAWTSDLRGDRPATDRYLRSALARGKDGSAAYFRWLLLGARRMLARALRAGVETDQVRYLIRRFRYVADDPLLESWPWPVKVRTLGAFSVELDDRPVVFGRKVPKRPLALLQCLIALGGVDVPEHRLADSLWPDADGDEAQQRFALTLHRLRQILGSNDYIRLQGGKVSLDRARVWVDALALEQTLNGQVDAAGRESALALYRGQFLENESDEPWMLQARERLGTLVGRHAPADSRVAPRIGKQKETSRPLL